MPLINVDINGRQIEKKYNRLDVCRCLRVSGAHQLGTLEYQSLKNIINRIEKFKAIDMSCEPRLICLLALSLLIQKINGD